MTVHPLPLPPTDELLTRAEGRLRRQRGYARPLAGRSARHLESALRDIRALLAAQATPGAVWRPVDARTDGGDVTLDGVPVPAPQVVEGLSAGASAGVWLCTMGLDDGGIRATLGHNALATQLAGDLARQGLFAAARAAHAAIAAAHPDVSILRVALRADGARLWDTAAVLRLLPLLGQAPLGVTAPDGAGLHPAHSLLGVVMLRPRP